MLFTGNGTRKSAFQCDFYRTCRHNVPSRGIALSDRYSVQPGLIGSPNKRPSMPCHDL